MAADSQWVDDLGTEHPTAGRRPRILSLVPSLTELLFDMDLGDDVVGRTSYCVHPADGVDLVPSVGGTKRFHIDKALALRPTHALVNVDENPRDAVEALRKAGVDVIVTHPVGPFDNLRLYQLCGGIFDRHVQAEMLTTAFLRAMSDLQTRSGDRHNTSVLYLTWRDPWMTVSRETYISRMLSLVGWQTMPSQSESRYPVIDLDATLPTTDIVLLPSEPYAFQASDVPAFHSAFPAFRGEVRQIDGELISWYGSRAIQGLRYLTTLAESD